MRGKTAVLVIAASFHVVAGFGQSPTPTATPSPAVPSTTPSVEIYGTFPTNYKEIITEWLHSRLLSADTARIKWTSEPYPVDLPNGENPRIRGYRVDFTVDARNVFGAYTGRQKHGAIIRNGEVIQGVGLGY